MVSILLFLALSSRQTLCFHSRLHQMGASAKSVTLHWAWTLYELITSPNASQAKWHSAHILSSAFRQKYVSCFLPRSPSLHTIIHRVLSGCKRAHLHTSHHYWWGSVLMQTILKAFPLQIRSFPALSEIFLSQWAIKIITFNHILQLLHSTEGRLGELGPDTNILLWLKLTEMPQWI